MSEVNRTPSVRTCSICKKDLPYSVDHFHPCNSHKSKPNPLGLSRQCRPCHYEYSKAWHKRNPGKSKEYRVSTRRNDPERHKARITLKNRRKKATALLAYSPGGPKCACCSESAFEFLTIDHIGGGGNKHRREVGVHIYSVLTKAGFPPGYRVLCMNCNWVLGKYGYCPHQTPGVDIRALWPTKKAGPGPAAKVPTCIAEGQRN